LDGKADVALPDANRKHFTRCSNLIKPPATQIFIAFQTPIYHYVHRDMALRATDTGRHDDPAQLEFASLRAYNPRLHLQYLVFPPRRTP